jgi:hypothetical protein
VSDCQPALHATLYPDNSDEKKKFVGIVSKGKFKQYINSKLIKPFDLSVPAQREEFKENLFHHVFYGSAYVKEQAEVAKAFRTEFPELAAIIKELKQQTNKKLPVHMQHLEASVVIDKVDRIMTIAFNPATEEFRVSDAATQRNPEFINNVTDLFSKASTRTFINKYLDKLRKEKDNLRKKWLLISAKITEKQELNKGDIELLSDKIKSSEVFSENGIIWEKLGLTEKKSIEDEEDGGEENRTEDETDIVEAVNDGLSLMSADELGIANPHQLFR